MLIAFEGTNRRGNVWINPQHVTSVGPLGSAPTTETVVHLSGGGKEYVMGRADDIASRLNKEK